MSTASRRNASCFVLIWRETHCGKPAKRFQCACLLYQSVAGLLWEVAKRIYIPVLPLLEFRPVYGAFSVSVLLMMWAFVSGLLMLGGVHYSASCHALRLARDVSLRHHSYPESDIRRASEAPPHTTRA